MGAWKNVGDGSHTQKINKYFCLSWVEREKEKNREKKSLRLAKQLVRN